MPSRPILRAGTRLGPQGAQGASSAAHPADTCAGCWPICLAHLKRPSPQVGSVQLQQIEGIEERFGLFPAMAEHIGSTATPRSSQHTTSTSIKRDPHLEVVHRRRYPGASSAGRLRGASPGTFEGLWLRSPSVPPAARLSRNPGVQRHHTLGIVRGHY
jgi:hypothetical protein